MKFVKTIYSHEFGGQRVTPLGVINFNHLGVCVIDDDELAQKVVNCSKSLAFADESDESIAKLKSELSAADVEQNKQVSEAEIGKFVKSAGVVAESTNFKKHGQQTIGHAASNAGEENGSFVQTTETEKKDGPAPIGAPASDDDKGSEEGSGDQGSEEGSNEESNSGSGDAESNNENVNSDELVAAQLQEFEEKDIREMIESAKIEIPEGDQTKESLIKIAVDNKIMD